MITWAFLGKKRLEYFSRDSLNFTFPLPIRRYMPPLRSNGWKGKKMQVALLVMIRGRFNHEMKHSATFMDELRRMKSDSWDGVGQSLPAGLRWNDSFLMTVGSASYPLNMLPENGLYIRVILENFQTCLIEHSVAAA